MAGEAIIRTQAVRIAQVRQATVSTVQRSWLALDNYRDADIAAWVRQVTPVVQAGQVRTAALTDAYLAAYRQEATGIASRPVGVPTEVAIGARGVPTADVYARMGPEVWSQLAKDRALEFAVQQGLYRAVKVAQTDMQLAKIHSANYVMGAQDVTTYRRVVNGETCSLCISAAQRTYYISNLLPIHPGCDCGVVPVFRDAPDPQINQNIEPADDRGETEVHQHGELGPVLTVRGQYFEGPR